MTIYAHSHQLPFCCGVDSVGRFQYDRDQYSSLQPIERLFIKPGTGLFTAEFVDDTFCKEAYDFLCNKYTLLYQSPVRLNMNSGRSLFMCIFSTI